MLFNLVFIYNYYYRCLLHYYMFYKLCEYMYRIMKLLINKVILKSHINIIINKPLCLIQLL